MKRFKMYSVCGYIRTYRRMEGIENGKSFGRPEVETNVHLSRDLRTVADEIVEGVVVTNVRNAK